MLAKIIFLNFVIIIISFSQESQTFSIGKVVEDYGANSLILDNVSVSSTSITFKFYFYNASAYGEANCLISAIATDSFSSKIEIKGITVGKSVSVFHNSTKNFTLKITRPFNLLKIKFLIEGYSFSSKIKLSKTPYDYNDRYEYREVFDISDFIDKITYNPNKEVEKKIIKTKEITKKHDTEKPSLTIISPLINKGIIRTEESFITISGNATDKEGIAFVTINDKNAQLKSNGDFLSRIKLKIGKNTITVKAVDINDNETTKEFVVIREEFTQESEFSDVDFAPERKNKNENGIAVVFGIEEYQYAPKVTYAYSDADIFREYLVKSFGFKRENIYFRTSERATKGEFDKVFSLNGWLAKQATSKSDVVIFYAGHGAPEIKSESAYLIPYDIDPNYSSTGYALQELYDNLGKIQAKSITVFLDACFSGGTRDNQSLLSEARPVHLKIKGSIVPDNTIVFSASANNEISSGYSQKLHGLFSYFVLKGFNGYADVNKDEKITVEELQNYLSENVSTQAKKMGREQNPQLLGKERNRVLLKY